jgi:hypothetical protein
VLEDDLVRGEMEVIMNANDAKVLSEASFNLHSSEPGLLTYIREAVFFNDVQELGGEWLVYVGRYVRKIDQILDGVLHLKGH